MTYHTEKIETAIAKIHECLDAPIDPVRVRRPLKDIGKWSAEAEQEAYARGLRKAAQIADAKARRVNSAWIAQDIAHDIRALIPEN